MARETTTQGGFFDVIFTLKNTAVGFVLTITLLFIASCFAALAALPEAIVRLIVTGITYLSIGVCGLRAARHLGRNGLLSGAIAGLIYFIVLFLIRCLVTGNFGFAPSSVLTVIMCILSGAVGGIIGLNIRHKKRR